MRRIRGGQLAKAMLFGALGTLLGVAINAALDYARQDWTNPIGIAVVAVLASVSGVIPLLQAERVPSGGPPRRGTVYPSGPAVGQAQVPRYGGQPPSQYDWAAPQGPPPTAPGQPAARRRGAPLLVAALVLLVLCGGGAAGATYGVKFLGGLITGDERGTDLLVRPATGTAGTLTLTVDKVEQTRHFTRVHLQGRNTGEEIPKLVAGFCQLTGGGTTKKPDAFKSDWPEDVPPGREGVAGWLVFEGHLPPGTTSASLTFTVIFGSVRGGRSITVADIPLRAQR
jgi:hypothetical protein